MILRNLTPCVVLLALLASCESEAPSSGEGATPTSIGTGSAAVPAPEPPPQTPPETAELPAVEAPPDPIELPTGPPRTWDGAPGSTMPEYEARRLDGTTFSLAELRGHPFLLNFWATWCVPCRAEFPALGDLQRRLREAGLEVVGVSLDSHLEDAEVGEFAERNGIDYTVLHDPESGAEPLFGVPPLPGNFVFDAEGRLVYSALGGGPETLAELFAAARAVCGVPEDVR